MILIFILILVVIIFYPILGGGNKLNIVRKLIKQTKNYLIKKKERVKISYMISKIIMLLIGVKSGNITSKLFKKKNKYYFLDDYAEYGDKYVFCILDPACTGYVGSDCLLTAKQIKKLTEFFKKELSVKKKDYVLIKRS